MPFFIKLNGKEETILKSMSISDFLTLKDIDPAKVVVEHNLTILKKDSLGNIQLKENDTLEILHFVGGG